MHAMWACRLGLLTMVLVAASLFSCKQRVPRGAGSSGKVYKGEAPGERGVGVGGFICLAGGMPTCTATLIAPDIAITAHHCIEHVGKAKCLFTINDDLMSIYARDLTVESGRPRERQSADLIEGYSIPGTKDGQLDAAVIRLDRRVFLMGDKDVPRSILRSLNGVPLEVPTEESTSPEVTIVGYGENETGEDGVGEKRAGEVSYVTAMKDGADVTKDKTRYNLAKYLVLGQSKKDGAIGCKGDSGGPVFDSQGKVIGVLSMAIDFKTMQPAKCGAATASFAFPVAPYIKSVEEIVKKAEKTPELVVPDGAISTTDFKGAEALCQKSTAGLPFVGDLERLSAAVPRTIDAKTCVWTKSIAFIDQLTMKTPWFGDENLNMRRDGIKQDAKCQVLCVR